MNAPINTNGSLEKLYLAGPMSGVVQFNYPSFHEAAARLRALGFEVLNPAELFHEILEDGYSPKNWEFYMKGALREMMVCDSLVMLENWDMSRGATIEKELAEKLRMQVYFMKDFT